MSFACTLAPTQTGRLTSGWLADPFQPKGLDGLAGVRKNSVTGFPECRAIGKTVDRAVHRHVHHMQLRS
jgi:hypothetical protein